MIKPLLKKSRFRATFLMSIEMRILSGYNKGKDGENMKYFIKEYDTRYFAGIEFENGVSNLDDMKKIPKLWDKLFVTDLKNIQNTKSPHHFIGLEMYGLDFQETGTFDYYAMIETEGLIEPNLGIVTKKLKKGRYICFPIPFDQISQEIKLIYDYIKSEKIKVHMGFDYEDYLPTEDYGEAGAILNFCLLLEEDAK